MTTVLRGALPPEVKALLDRRRAQGQDLFDEVWNGNYVMAPAPGFAHSNLDQQVADLLGSRARQCGLLASGPFNLGDGDNYRVPDRGVHRGTPTGVWLDTAAIVVEIVSPDDASWDKLDHYAEHGVDEVVIVDPETRRVHWLALTHGKYVDIGRSAVLDVDVADLAAAIDWPE